MTRADVGAMSFQTRSQWWILHEFSFRFPKSGGNGYWITAGSYIGSHDSYKMRWCEIHGPRSPGRSWHGLNPPMTRWYLLVLYLLLHYVTLFICWRENMAHLAQRCSSSFTSDTKWWYCLHINVFSSSPVWLVSLRFSHSSPCDLGNLGTCVRYCILAVRIQALSSCYGTIPYHTQPYPITTIFIIIDCVAN